MRKPVRVNTTTKQACPSVYEDVKQACPRACMHAHTGLTLSSRMVASTT